MSDLLDDGKFILNDFFREIKRSFRFLIGDIKICLDDRKARKSELMISAIIIVFGAILGIGGIFLILKLCK